MMNLSDREKILFFAGLAIMFFGAMLFLAASDRKVLRSIQNGDAELYCTFPSGEKKVEKEMVVDFYDGYWVFTNGGAKSCSVYKAK